VRVSVDTFKRPRIAIIGSCQVVGLAAATRRLLPGAEVKAWHIGVHPKDSDEDILALLPGFDLVLSQIPDWDEHVSLRFSRLREHGLNAVYLPVLTFPGFHPDITYIRAPDGSMRHGLGTDYHSLIVASAFVLGLPEQRIPSLFNSYVFAELGYFEVFEAAKKALLNNFRNAGYDLGLLFDMWIRQVGQFMYTINHPHILVLATLCRVVLARANLVDVMTPMPENIDDSLAAHFIWPTYPSLAKRIGLSGSTTFLVIAHGLAEGQARELPLTDYITGCYRKYSRLQKDTLRVGDVAKACDRLGAIVVR
jgi:hypothetical protein